MSKLAGSLSLKALVVGAVVAVPVGAMIRQGIDVPEPRALVVGRELLYLKVVARECGLSPEQVEIAGMLVDHFASGMVFSLSSRELAKVSRDVQASARRNLDADRAGTCARASRAIVDLSSSS